MLPVTIAIGLLMFVGSWLALALCRAAGKCPPKPPHVAPRIPSQRISPEQHRKPGQHKH